MVPVYSAMTKEQTGTELVMVRAECGPFVVHRGIGAHERRWTVTHVGSLQALAVGIPSQAKAIHLATTVAKVRGVNWSFKTRNAVKRWPAKVKARMRELIKELGGDLS